MIDIKGAEEQIRRIEKYEKILDEARELLEKGQVSEHLSELVGELDSYYTGPLWRQDYEDDEAGLIPADLKRGILSQDAIYDLLTEYDGLADGLEEPEDELRVLNYFETDDKDHWLDEFERSDWSAGPFLARLLREGQFFDTLGEDSIVLLLTKGDELISYCTFAERDDIQPTDLTPWVGFVYTFPEHRGHRYMGILFEEILRRCREGQIHEVYLSTNHTGLYEKYGWEFFGMMEDIHGEPSRIYVRRIDAE